MGSKKRKRDRQLDDHLGLSGSAHAKAALGTFMNFIVRSRGSHDYALTLNCIQDLFLVVS